MPEPASANPAPVSPAPASSPPAPTPLALEHLHEQTIILDTQGPLIYIGTLAAIAEAYLVLRDADVHDTNDSRASKDLYLAETRNLGVRINRARVLVMRSQIASVSLLHEVID